MVRRLGALLGMVPSAWTIAQPQYFFVEVSNAVTPAQPTTRIDVWAGFDPAYYAFAASRFQITTGPGQGDFFDPRLPDLFYGDAGEIISDGDIVSGVYPYQLQHPFTDYADPSNPILIWSCSWTTGDFSPRHVEVDLLAPDFFRVFFNWFGDQGDVEYQSQAAGSVLVVPAPAVGAALILAGSAALYRRR